MIEEQESGVGTAGGTVPHLQNDFSGTEYSIVLRVLLVQALVAAGPGVIYSINVYDGHDSPFRMTDTLSLHAFVGARPACGRQKYRRGGLNTGIILTAHMTCTRAVKKYARMLLVLVVYTITDWKPQTGTYGPPTPRIFWVPERPSYPSSIITTTTGIEAQTRDIPTTG